MEQLRILASAAALREFQIPQLAAYSGANERTVRSVVRRLPDLFKEIGKETNSQRPGPPRKRYRVTDVDQIRAQVAALERDILRPALIDEVDHDEREMAEQYRAAMIVAEDAVLRAWRDETAEDQHRLARIALRTLTQ